MAAVAAADKSEGGRSLRRELLPTGMAEGHRRVVEAAAAMSKQLEAAVVAVADAVVVVVVR